MRWIRLSVGVSTHAKYVLPYRVVKQLVSIGFGVHLGLFADICKRKRKSQEIMRVAIRWSAMVEFYMAHLTQRYDSDVPQLSGIVLNASLI